MTRYLYRRAIGGLFHVNGAWARTRVPKTLSPLELRLGSAILSVVVFDFVDCEAGPFTELAMMLLVPPAPRPTETLPEVGLTTHLLCTSTEASRRLACDRLGLPVHPQRIDARFTRDGAVESAEVFADGDRVLELTVTRRKSAPASRLFQCFTHDDAQVRCASVRMQGWLGEHEDETGRLELFAHPLVADLGPVLEDAVPFREQVIEGGQEDFGAMVPL